MNTKAVRLHAASDLRLDEYPLPAIRDDEILCRVVSDSICMSSYKAAIQGTEHKRVPDDIDVHPVIIGHEFCGEIVEVGKKWQDEYKVGQKVTVQPNMRYHGSPAAFGYSFEYCGGSAQYVIFPNQGMETKCVLPYNGEAYFFGSLAEPLSCIAGAFNSNYHTTTEKYEHIMGVKKGGNLAILAGAGPMGLGAIEYAIHMENGPATVVITDIDDARLARAEVILPPAEAAKNGVKLYYVNTAKTEDPKAALMALTDGQGFDDVFIFTPVAAVAELGDAILGYDGCMNFFAGPTDHAFAAKFNFYNVHYNYTHVVGSSGGNSQDMRDCLRDMETGRLNPACMVTHIGGLDAAAEATLNLPKIPGGKKLIYTHISMPITAITEFEEKGKTDPLFAGLAEICNRHNGLWSVEAEQYLLKNAKPI